MPDAIAQSYDELMQSHRDNARKLNALRSKGFDEYRVAMASLHKAVGAANALYASGLINIGELGERLEEVGKSMQAVHKTLGSFREW